jgi:hypothetical protein
MRNWEAVWPLSLLIGVVIFTIADAVVRAASSRQ